jgi:hypothetical protein
MGYELVWDLIAAAQLAAQLRTSEQRFGAVVEAVPSAILLALADASGDLEFLEITLPGEVVNSSAAK